MQNQKIKAVGLISGGLDSLLAAKILLDMNIEVHGIHFAMPFDHKSNDKLQKVCEKLGVIYHTIQLDNEYMKMLESPRYGYGSAFNPCIDCHAFMIQKAAEFMKSIDAKFVFTGEVLGQRPMSQHKNGLEKVLKSSGLEGYLLRPLSAKHLDPTIPEQEGLIDRNKLLGISGRGRQEQLALAEKYNITEYPQPAGGCLLTDKNYGNRIKDLVKSGEYDYTDTICLKWGRHFKISDTNNAILGRNNWENESLSKYTKNDSIIMHLKDKTGPVAIIKGKKPSDETLQIAAGLIVRYSKYNIEDTQALFFLKSDPQTKQEIQPQRLTEEQIEKMRI